MDWPNEYWIKCYVKDSPSFAKCSWKAKGLFYLIARKVNAAGMIAMVKDDPVESARFLSTRLEAPWDEIRHHVVELIVTETIHIPMDWSLLVIPNFVPAQKAVWDKTIRKRVERKRKADMAQVPEYVPAPAGTLVIPPPTPEVPIPYMPSGEDLVAKSEAPVSFADFVPVPSETVKQTPYVTGHVTKCDKVSHTDQKDRSRSERGSSIPLRGAGIVIDQGLTETAEEGEGSDPSQQELLPGQLALLPEGKPTKSERDHAIIDEVWLHYLHHWDAVRPKGHRPVLSPKRRSQIKERVKEHGLETVLTAIDRLWQSKWRVREGYAMIEHVIRTTEQLELILAQDPNARGTHKACAAPLQPSCSEDYVGKGKQLFAGSDGKIRDQHGAEVAINDDLESISWG